MNALKLLAALAVGCLVGTPARADEKDYAKQIVGKWEVTKADKGSIPPGAVIEFTRDGKMKIAAKKEDMEVSFDGTYKLDGNKVAMTMKLGEKERTNTITIQKLSDTEMSVEGDDGKKVEFTKKK
jgi:uncharacterized protein (TIGR03066 family)